jgi:hypothetical protein
MSTPQKKNPTSRAEAGLVEEDAEIQPQDEAISDGSWLDEEDQEPTELVSTPQSSLKIAGMSEEEQSMEMTPVVVGPPGYGSPDAITSAGRLLPLDQHPFNPESLPADHPARIDEEYGKGYSESISAENIGQSFPGTSSGSDLENDLLGESTDSSSPTDYNAQTKDELLTEAQNRGLDVTASNTKAEIVSALQADDAAKAGT